MSNIKQKISETIKEHFRFSTLSFLFIIIYVNVFQYILGPENSIVGVIFTIMMSASMVRDLTGTPVKHLLIQSLVLIWMALAAFWVNVCPPPLSFVIHFVTLLAILYAFTYEYSDHMYFPYILSYLFLVFISPVTAVEGLPKRLIGMLAGAVSIMLYQWVMGRKRVKETARDVLSEMIDDINAYISARLRGESPGLPEARRKLCRLSKTVYERRRKALCVSDAAFSMIAAGRGLEHLLLLVHELPELSESPEDEHAGNPADGLSGGLSRKHRDLLNLVSGQLTVFRAFLHQELTALPSPDPTGFTGKSSAAGEDNAAGLFLNVLVYIRDRLLHMSDPQKRTHYRKTALSLKVRLQAALDLSPVRAVYALRVALLLSCGTLLVQLLGLPHGKWLLFTMASVSLPYADDVPVKIRKRVLATVIGGLVSVVIFALVPSAGGRTAIMMLSGYVSFYFRDYTQTFACSTVGALGGAVFMGAFGFPAVGSMFLIRLGYILAGIVIAYAANCLLFPFSRAMATRQLWEKYKSVSGLLAKICRSEDTDPQLYYNLVIQAHLLEEKLTRNAELEEWTELSELLADCRERVRRAHRAVVAGRADAPVLETAHLS